MSFQRAVHSDRTEETGVTKLQHPSEGPNDIHKNARLTPLRREEMALSVIEGRLSQAHAARVYGVSAKIVARWVERYKAEARTRFAGHFLFRRPLRPKKSQSCQT